MLVFNETYYLAQNPDVAAAISANLIANAETHFLQHGYSEGRDPNPYFDTSYYLQQNTDVATAGVNPLTHYNTFGEDEGRGPNAIFNPTYYASQNPDVVSAGVNLLEHFINHGAAEGRFPNATTASELASGFDETAYLAANPDVAEAISNGTFSSGYQHWSLHGYAEGRTGAQNSSGEALSVPSTGSSGPLSGFVIDGKVSGATVGIDLDGDGVIGPNEPTVTTDALGEFVFPDGTPVGPIIATGGTDISTGLPFDGKLEAPAGSTVVNPLTTVIKKIADANTDPTKSETEKVADAQTQLKSLLGLSDINADITQVDFVTEATEGDSSGADDAVSDSDGARLYSASIQLLNIVDQGAAAISGADGSVAPEDASAAMFASLAEKLASTPDGQTVDLGSTAGSDGDASNDTGDLLIDVIKGAAANTLSGDAITKVDQIADSAAAIAAAANKEISERIDALDPNAAGSAIESTLIEVVKTQKVVQGSAADNIKAAAGSDNPDAAAQAISDSIAAPDGSGFVSDDLIDEQTVGDIDGDGTDDDVPAPTPTPGTGTPPPGPTFNVINGTDDGETIDGTNGNDEINALGGNDIINPGAGEDIINGGAGNDQITIDATGEKRIVGGEGDDEFIRTENGTGVINFRYDNEGGSQGISFFQTSVSTAEVNDTYGDTDTLTYTGPTNISFSADWEIYGTSGDDTFGIGAGADTSGFNDEDDFFAGMLIRPFGGDDTITGNPDEFVSIYYRDDVDGAARTQGIQVTWGAAGGTVNDGLGGTDTFQNTNQVVGTDLDDVFTSQVGADRARFRGLDGEDTFTGNGDNDIVDYRFESFDGTTGGVFVDLNQGTATDGFGNTDTLVDIERVRGTDIEGVTDVLLGSGEDNRLRGYDGDDQLDGRGGNDILNGGNGNDTINGGTDDDTITGDDGDDILNGGTGFDYIVGGSGNDSITATSGFNSVIGGSGDDTVTGSTVGGSGVQMQYADEGGGQGITVTFTTDLDATVNDTFGDTDTLTDVFTFVTTASQDTITGPNGDIVNDRSFWIDMIAGGNDTINITSHQVVLDYSQHWHTGLATPQQGIVFNLSNLDVQGNATITDTQGDTDTVFYWASDKSAGVNTIIGSELADSMIGGDGDDVLIGNDGTDTINGGAGIDTVDYSFLEFQNENNGFTNIFVDLDTGAGTGTATDGFGKIDTLSNIENVNGSNGTDNLTGDGENNNLSGNGGDDILDGDAGDDFLVGGEGDDQITTGAGSDTVYYFSIQAHGEDTITDFTLNEDKILFDTIAQSDVDNFQLSLTNGGQDTLIVFGMVNNVDLGQVTLTGVNTGTLGDIVAVFNPL